MLVFAHTDQSFLNIHTWVRERLGHPSEPPMGRACHSHGLRHCSLDGAVLMLTIDVHSGFPLLLILMFIFQLLHL